MGDDGPRQSRDYGRGPSTPQDSGEAHHPTPGSGAGWADAPDYVYRPLLPYENDRWTEGPDGEDIPPRWLTDLADVMDVVMPVVRETTSLAVDLAPVVGDAKGFQELITGTDLITGKNVGWFDRLTGLLPVIGGLGRFMGGLAERGLPEAAKLAERLAIEERAINEARLAALQGADAPAATLRYFDAKDAAREAADIVREAENAGEGVSTAGEILEYSDDLRSVINYATDQMDRIHAAGPGNDRAERLAYESHPLASSAAVDHPGSGAYDNDGDGWADESRSRERTSTGDRLDSTPAVDDGASGSYDNDRDGWADESRINPPSWETDEKGTTFEIGQEAAGDPRESRQEYTSVNVSPLDSDAADMSANASPHAGADASVNVSPLDPGTDQQVGPDGTDAVGTRGHDDGLYGTGGAHDDGWGGQVHVDDGSPSSIHTVPATEDGD